MCLCVGRTSQKVAEMDFAGISESKVHGTTEESINFRLSSALRIIFRKTRKPQNASYWNLEMKFPGLSTERRRIFQKVANGLRRNLSGR